MFLESVSAEGATVFGVFSILLYCLKMVGDNAFQWEKEEEEKICQKWQLTGKEPSERARARASAGEVESE